LVEINSNPVADKQKRKNGITSQRAHPPFSLQLTLSHSIMETASPANGGG
jgi:hypothetical protein